MPQVHGHHHLAIQVKDLPAAERFYVEALGLRVLRRWPWEDGRPGERAVWLSVGTGEEFLALESCDVDRPPTPFRDPHGGRGWVGGPHRTTRVPETPRPPTP